MLTKLNRQSILPIVMMLAGLTLFIWSILWFVGMNGDTSRNSVQNSSPPSSASIPLSQIRRVSLLDAKKAHDLGSAMFVDVRGDRFFAQEHITGALSIAEEEIESRLDELNPEDWIITYCT